MVLQGFDDDEYSFQAGGGCKRITLKEALRMWEERGECPLEEVTELKLNGWHPPIEKIDGSTTAIPKCEQVHSYVFTL